MYLKQFLSHFYKTKPILSKRLIGLKTIKPIYFYVTIFLIFFVYLSININTNLKEKRAKEISSFLLNNQTVLLKNYIFNKIKSPYLEYDYVVKTNDSIESILKKFSVKKNEVAFVVKTIKKRKLSSITPGQKIKFILKKYMSYIAEQLLKDVPIRSMTRHILGLYHGESNAKLFRRLLSGKTVEMEHLNDWLDYKKNRATEIQSI